MKVLVACEYSGRVRDAFIRMGHEAISCDLLPSESNFGPHLQIDIIPFIKKLKAESYDLLIAHPPCTYLTNAGVRHLHSTPSKNGVIAKVNGEARWQAMREAAEFFNILKNAPIEKICVENPIPHKYAREIIGKYDQIIQPWQFGHGETKKTCLWLKNLPHLIPTNIVDGRYPACHMVPPSKDRWKIRSLTYQGFADAFAMQWGGIVK